MKGLAIVVGPAKGSGSSKGDPEPEADPFPSKAAKPHDDKLRQQLSMNNSSKLDDGDADEGIEAEYKSVMADAAKAGDWESFAEAVSGLVKCCSMPMGEEE